MASYAFKVESTPILLREVNRYTYMIQSKKKKKTKMKNPKKMIINKIYMHNVFSPI